MQAKRKLLPILVITLFAALLVAACGGGAGGGESKTWFNLPSVPVSVDASGNADIYGIPLGPIVPAAAVQQLQSLDAQKVEARAGANGIYVIVNGEQLPYVRWDDQSLGNLEDVLSAVPGAAQANPALPWLRRIGLGATLKLPPAQGQAPLDIPRWTGEKTLPPAAENPDALNLNMLSFDEQGNASVAGISAATLSQLTGASVLPQLTPDQLALIKSLGIDDLSIKTTSGGIDIAINGTPLPSIAYDSESLQSVLALAGPMLGDAAGIVDSLLPMLTERGVNVGINFTGQPSEVSLSELVKTIGTIKVGEDGALDLMGMSLPGVSLPPDLLETLKGAELSSLGIKASPESILVSANGQTLPKINLAPDGIKLVSSLASDMAGVSPDMITTALGLLGQDGISTALALPGAESAEPPAEPSYAAADLGDMPAPSIRASVTVQDGQITAVGNLTAEQLDALGVSLPTLPPNVMDILNGVGAKQLDIIGAPNNLQIHVNGAEALSLDHDEASLKAALNVAKPFLAGTPLEDPAVMALIEEQVLPILPAADLQIRIAIE